jgi:hypothetical protein
VYAWRDVDVEVGVDFGDKCDERSFNAVLNPLPRRSIAALSFYERVWEEGGLWWWKFVKLTEHWIGVRRAESRHVTWKKLGL